ncbi:MAG: acyl carrier protein [Casimicrobium sp.]
MVSPDTAIHEASQRILELVKEHFPAVNLDGYQGKNMHEIGLDSLDMVDLAWVVENEFSIKFSDDDLQKITSLEALAKLVTSKNDA